MVEPFSVSATTNTRFVPGSITGVDVMPTVGEMSPHGSCEEGTGVPALTCHTTCPVVSFSAAT